MYINLFNPHNNSVRGIFILTGFTDQGLKEPFTGKQLVGGWVGIQLMPFVSRISALKPDMQHIAKWHIVDA